MWQLMRAYVISLLQKLAGDGTAIGDKEILAWANDKVRPVKNLRRFFV
jgi:hypothetical protein